MSEPSLPNCPRCNAPVRAGLTSCPSCGYPIEVDLSAPAGAKPGAELDVTVWLTEAWRMFLPNAAAFVGFGTVAVIATVATMMASEHVPLIGWLLPTVVSAPLFAGFLTAAFKLRRGEVLEFGDFLRGFDYIVPLVLGTLVSNVLVTVGFLLLILPGIYLMVGYTFMTPLIVDGRLDFWQAMEGSRRVVHEHWLNFFTFAGALFLVNLAGILVFGVGLLVSMPVTYCAVAVAYDQVFGLRRA